MSYLRYPQLRSDDAAQRDGYFGSAVRRTKACFDCRIALKGQAVFTRLLSTQHCPRCGKLLRTCPNWRFPKRSDVKGWKLAEERWARIFANQDVAEKLRNRWKERGRA